MHKPTKATVFIVTFIVIMCGIAYYFYFIDLYPQKSNTDFWTHLAIINELKVDNYNQINTPFFTSGDPDPRSGSYLTFIAIISHTLNISTINTYLFFGLVNIIFFVACAYFFARTVLREYKYYFLFPLLLFFLWGPSRQISANMFSFNEALWIGPFYHFFVTGLFFLGLAFAYTFIKAEKDKMNRWVMLVIVGFVLFNTHMLTGLYLFLGIFALVVNEIIHKRFNNYTWLLIASPVAIFLINFTWPLYDQLKYFYSNDTLNVVRDESKIVSETSISSIFNGLYAYLMIAGISVLGVFFLFHSKKRLYFLILLFCTVVLIILTGYTPVPIRFYWRFAPLLVFAGTAGWVVYVSRLNYKKIFLVLSLVIVLGVSYMNYKYKVFDDWQPFTYQQSYYHDQSVDFGIAADLPKDSVVFMDEQLSHIFSGLTEHNVIGVRPKHLSFSQDKIQREGYFDIISAFEDPAELDGVIKKHAVTHLLLKANPDIEEAQLGEYAKKHYLLVNEDEEFQLYKVQ